MKIARYKHEAETSYALGATLTYELIKKRPESVVRVFIKSTLTKTAAVLKLMELCRQKKIPVLENDKAFNVLSPKGNCFVIGEFKKFADPLKKGSHIVLVNPSDAGNLGTILRTAVGFGLDQIAIVRPAVDFFDPKTVRASMGAAFGVNVQYFDTIEAYRETFPENRLYAFMLSASRPIHNIKITEPYSLVFGNEATGLPDVFASFCQSVIIPHSNGIDSLNLPIAAGIAMYEFTKALWSKTE
ncbi:MAG: TrmH family RNA methyltransferase [Clostridia bacterium]|nr:TrmH family RNA methyltransferase [Clostridia bacterium]